MADAQNKGGRPFLTPVQKEKRKDYLLRKLEPYLKSGLSVNKALKEAKVHNSEFYRYMKADRLFGEEIARFKQYISVLVNQIFTNELLWIAQKQNGDKTRGIEPQELNSQDVEFLIWYGTHALVCGEEWGRRKEINYFDPELELQKLKQLIDDSIASHINPYIC